MEIIVLDSVDSTNSWVADHERELPSPVIVRCNTQKAGRGQRGNSWEARPGENFTGSVLLHPENMPACSQFSISEAVALAVVKTLEHFGIRAKVKWPNDIYVGDKKICGILVEHVVTGSNISRTIAGIGLNINQEVFVSDAPNPISMKQETGKEFDINEVSAELGRQLESFLMTRMNREEIHDNFMRSLWRNDAEFYNFADKIKNEQIFARIVDVAHDGILSLATDSGELRQYAFKEIEFLLE